MTPEERRRLLVGLGLVLVAYLGLGLLVRSSTIPGEVHALVWSAAGAAMVLVALAPRRSWPVLLAVVGLASFLAGLAGGADWAHAALLTVPSLVQAGVGAVLLHRAVPELVVGGGREALRTFRQYCWLIAAAALSSGLAVLSGALLLELGGSPWALTDQAVLWGRNTTGPLVLLTLAVLLLGDDAAPQPEVPESVGERTPRQHHVELVALFAATTLMYAGIFTSYAELPVAFPLLVPTVWAGLRFSPRLVTLHSFVAAAFAVGTTLAGVGPFAGVAVDYQRALLLQLFLLSIFALGILLSLASQERRALARTLHRAHGRAADQAALLSTVINSMREGVTVVDDQGVVQLQNPAAYDLMHSAIDVDGPLRSAPIEVRDFGGDEVPLELWPFARALRGEEVIGQELRICFQDGIAERDVSVSARRLPFQTEAGRPQAVVIYHDITVERAQRVALESFARTVAHDLKGPLGIVEGWTELLVGDAAERDLVPGEDVVRTGNRIMGAAATMRQLIRDLLESSVSRDQQLRVSEIDLRLLAEQVADQHRSVVDGTAPRIVVAEDIPPVSADEPQVRQLLHNLIGNACKYVPEGDVADISITGRPLGDQVEVVVADRGIGIPRGRHDEVFAVFSRAHSETAAYEGHGIGLSVCKSIVSRHGGAIHARPRRSGRGTAFVFTLPAVPARRSTTV